MTSQPFATPSRDYINKLALSWLWRRLWFLVIPLAAVLMWTLFDIRALFVALIMLLWFYPMTLLLVCFKYALSPQSIRATTLKQVTVSDDGLKIDFLPENEDCKPLPSINLIWGDIRSIELSSSKMTLILGSRLDDCLCLPADAFSSQAWTVIYDHLADKLPSPEIL